MFFAIHFVLCFQPLRTGIEFFSVLREYKSKAPMCQKADSFWVSIFLGKTSEGPEALLGGTRRGFDGYTEWTFWCMQNIGAARC